MIGKPIDVREIIDESLSEKENIERINKILREKVVSLGNELNKKTKKEMETF